MRRKGSEKVGRCEGREVRKKGGEEVGRTPTNDIATGLIDGEGSAYIRH